jgi:hypothetical protein
MLGIFITNIEEIVIFLKILMEKSYGKRVLGRSSHRWRM